MCKSLKYTYVFSPNSTRHCIAGGPAEVFFLWKMTIIYDISAAVYSIHVYNFYVRLLVRLCNIFQSFYLKNLWSGTLYHVILILMVFFITTSWLPQKSYKYIFMKKTNRSGTRPVDEKERESGRVKLLWLKEIIRTFQKLL